MAYGYAFQACFNFSMKIERWNHKPLYLKSKHSSTQSEKEKEKEKNRIQKFNSKSFLTKVFDTLYPQVLLLIYYHSSFTMIFVNNTIIIIVSF